MQRFIRLAAVVAAIVFGGAAQAQLPPALITPLEVRTCDFVEGKGQGDLDRLATDLNRWMTESAAPQYEAHVLLPLMHSREIDFDLAWIGAWPDGATMGESLAHYFENGGALDALFDGVMRCRDNTNFSAVTLRAPPRDGFGPLEVTTCKLRLGAELQEALGRVREWVDYTATLGSTSGQWLLFPALGERSDADYTFKWAVGYASYVAFGRDYDQLTNGSALDHYNELLDASVRCDSPRLYAVKAVRRAAD